MLGGDNESTEHVSDIFCEGKKVKGIKKAVGEEIKKERSSRLRIVPSDCKDTCSRIFSKVIIFQLEHFSTRDYNLKQPGTIFI